MKGVLLFLLCIITVSGFAQTVTSGPKLVTSTATTVTFAIIDTNLVGQRYAVRNNLKGPYTTADTLNSYNNGYKAKVCPPVVVGFTQAQMDSAVAYSFRQGQNQKPSVTINTPDSIYVYK